MSRPSKPNPISVCTALGLIGAALAIQATSAQAGEPIDRPLEPYFSFCRSDYLVGNTFYFSATQPIDAGVARQDLQRSFHDFLAEKYRYPSASGVSCVFAVGGDLQADTESARQQTINNLHSANYGVVETDWTYRK